MCSQEMVLCFLVALHIQSLQAENSYEAKVRLESGLLNDYHKEIRPVLKYEDNVTITVGISLNHIKEMDDKNQILSLSLWFRQNWYDPRLTWQPSDFFGVNTTQISASKIWIPDLKVYNEAERRVDSGLDQFQTKLVISHSGKIRWMAPAVMKLTCPVDVTYFPYDTQTCKIKIGSWTYDGFAIDVKPESYTMDISKSPSNTEWVLVSTSVQKNVEHYPCCSEPYPDVTYTIKMKRRMQSYWVNFIFPGVLLTIMTMTAFLTSASDTGERVTLVLTSLVSMFVFLKMVAERTPASDTIPLLSVYFVMLSFEIALIFYSVCVSVNAFHQHPALGDMPGYIRTVILEKLGKIWGLTKEREDIRQKLDQLQNSSLIKNGAKDQIKEKKTTSDIELSTSVNTRKICIKNNQKTADGPRCKISTRTTSITVSECDSEVFYEEPVFLDSSIQFDTDCDGEMSQLRPSLSDRRQTTSKASKYRRSLCSCRSLLRDMTIANKKLLSSLSEIVYVARQLDKTSAEKEHWLLAAKILDRTFLAIFVVIFVTISLVNFLW